MNKQSSVIRIVSVAVLFFIGSGRLFCQAISEERKKIIGTWQSEEGEWLLTFKRDMTCIEYDDGKLEAKYLYKITSMNSVCGRLLKVTDTSTTLLQMDNIKTKERTCYYINGITGKVLSLQIDTPSPIVFNRIRDKTPPRK